MQEPLLTVHPGAVIVTVHGSTVVYVPERQELFELSLHAASLVSAVSAGDPGQLPQDLGGGAIDQLVDDLLALGILHESGPVRPRADGPPGGPSGILEARAWPRQEDHEWGRDGARPRRG